MSALSVHRLLHIVYVHNNVFTSSRLEPAERLSARCAAAGGGGASLPPLVGASADASARRGRRGARRGNRPVRRSTRVSARLVGSRARSRSLRARQVPRPPTTALPLEPMSLPPCAGPGVSSSAIQTEVSPARSCDADYVAIKSRSFFILN